jgi:putative FmdB family regulatory protein
MPIYEYRCEACAAHFEELTSATRAGRVRCPACGGARPTRLLSAFAVGGGASSTEAEAGPCGACGAAQRGMCGED